MLTPTFAQGDILGDASLDNQRGIMWETYHIDLYAPDTLATRQTINHLPYPFNIEPEGWASVTNKFMQVELVGTWNRIRVYLDNRVRPKQIFYYDYAFMDAADRCCFASGSVYPWDIGTQIVFEVPLYRGFAAFSFEYAQKAKG